MPASSRWTEPVEPRLPRRVPDALRSGTGVVLGVICGVCLYLAGMTSSVRGDEPSGLAAAASLEQTFIKVIEQGEPSVVSIARDKVRARIGDEIEDRIPRHAREDRSLSNPNYIPNEFGTGVVIRGDGLILTNYHVVRGGPILGKKGVAEQELYVRLSDRRGFPAQIFAADPRSDLAILKIPVEGLKPIKLGNATQARKGQLVVSLGNPYAIARDGSASASWGIISNISRAAHLEGEQHDDDYRKKETIHHLGTLLQLDTRLNLGTSGGPVLNFRGEMVGMTTSLAAIAGYEKSAGFAVPVNDGTQRIIQSLIRGEEVEYGFLGISPNDVSQNDHEMNGLPAPLRQAGAARVQNVYPNSPAGLGGLQSGDIILAMNNRPILSRTDLMREVGLQGPGTEVKFKVWRNLPNEVVDVDVLLGKWPVQDDEGIIATRRRHPFWRGLGIDYNTARYRHLPLQFRARNHDFPKGVLIEEIEPHSPAAAAELQAGDFITHVNGQAVTSPKQFYDAARSVTGDAQLSLEGSRRVTLKVR